MTAKHFMCTFYILQYQKCGLFSVQMDICTKKVTRKRKALDDCDSDAKINAKKDNKKTTKVTESKMGKSASKIHSSRNSVPDDIDGCAHSTENADNTMITEMWNEAEVLSHMVKVSQNVAQNFIALLTEGCTLPFIARYRKTAVNQMMPDR